MELRKHPFFKLHFEVRNGKGLIAMDRGGTSDPYLKCIQGGTHSLRRFGKMILSFMDEAIKINEKIAGPPCREKSEAKKVQKLSLV